jgi:hypothetical protein
LSAFSGRKSLTPFGRGASMKSGLITTAQLSDG